MRALLALVCAAAAGGYTLFMLAPNIATNMVLGQRFQTPLDVSATHAAAYLGTAFLAMLCGWVAGWILGFPLRRR